MKQFQIFIAVVGIVVSFNVRSQCGPNSASVSPQPVIICEGSSTVIDLSVSGVCPGNWQFEVLNGATVVQPWSTAITFTASPTTTTQYFLNARCSSCPTAVVQDTFTVNVIEDPIVTGNLSLCPGNSTTLTATGNASTIEWWSALSGGIQLSNNGNYTTPSLNNTSTFYVEQTDTVFGGSGTGSVLITECGLEGMIGGGASADYIEISNLYSTSINTTGWVVAVSSSYNNINSVNGTYWYLPSNFTACSVVTRNDVNSSPNYWGSNIFWNPNNNGWAIIIDNMGNVVDFAVWGWSAAAVAGMNTVINGFNITIGPEWIGNGCAASCGTTGGVQHSLARTGNSDNNVAADFICQPTTVDLVNPTLNCGWTSGTTCSFPVTAVVNPQLDATINPDGPFCVLDTAITLTAVDTGGVWSGIGIVDSIAGIFDATIAGVGFHTITYSINSLCGDTANYVYEVQGPDDASITPVPSLCLGSPPINLVAQTAGGIWSGTGITDIVNGVFDPTVAGPGSHAVTYVTNGPCPDTSTIDVDVFDPLSVQAFSDTVICDGVMVELTATGSGGNGSYDYLWSDQFGNSVGNGPVIQVTPSVTTTYTVALLDYCTSPVVTSNVTIVVYPIPAVSFTADSLLGCSPLEVNFVNTSNPMGTDVFWDFNNGSTSDSLVYTQATFTGFGCYDISLTVTENGCTNSLTLQDYICVAPQPESDWTYSPENMNVLDPEVVFTNYSTNAEFYAWDFDDGTQTDELNPIHLFPYDAGGYYVCLAVSNSYGCIDTHCEPITVDDLLLFYVPNTFTPNGDEFNQIFQPVFTSGFDPFDFHFEIYNQWGQIIWESYDYRAGWNGTFDNKLVQSGAYNWKVEFKMSMNDARAMYTGSFSLLR